MRSTKEEKIKLEKFLSEITYFNVVDVLICMPPQWNGQLTWFFIIIVELDFVGILWVENGLKSSDIKCTIN